MTPDALTAALEATWPPESVHEASGWRLRIGRGGGKRVSAASPLRVGSCPDIAAAETLARTHGQAPLVVLGAAEAVLDAALEARGYVRLDPSLIYTAPSAGLAEPDVSRRGVICDLPLAVQQGIWAQAGIGPGRLAVMDRAPGPRAWLLSRTDDAPAGTAFVAAAGGVAMVHAIEVLPALRAQGHGRRLLALAACWACDVGAGTLALAVTEANAGAIALYRSAGMELGARYHYRARPEDAARPGAW